MKIYGKFLVITIFALLLFLPAASASHKGDSNPSWNTGVGWSSDFVVVNKYSSLTVRVIDKSANPLPEARVSVFVKMLIWDGEMRGEAITDSDGKAVVSKLKPNKFYTVKVQRLGKKEVKRTIYLKSSGKELTVRLR